MKALLLPCPNLLRTVYLTLLVSGLFCTANAQLPKPKPPEKTPEQLLFEALEADDPKRAEELILLGANPNPRQEGNGWTPLIAAVQQNKMAMALVLLRNGADPNLLSTDAYKNTALLFALEKRKESLPWVQLLLEGGADPNVLPGTKNYTPLMKAVTVGEAELVAMLVDRGADVMAADPQGGTALSRAIGLGNPDIIKLLQRETQKHVVKVLKPLKLSPKDHALFTALQAGNQSEALRLLADPETNPNARNAAGDTPLILAVRGAMLPVARRLIDLGANIHAPTRGEQPQPVIFMALGAPARLPLLELLLKMGAEPNARRPGDRCPVLLAAVEQGPPAAVEALIRAGARTEDADVNGRTPLAEAMTGESEEIRAIFRRWAEKPINKGDTSTPDSFASTMLTPSALARITGQVPGTEPTGAAANPLGAGKDRPVPNRHRMELHLAVAKGDLAQVKELLDNGADPNSYDSRGRSPLMTAADLTNAELCKMLINAGADVRQRSKDDFAAPAIIFAASRQSSIEALRVLLEAKSDPNARLAEWAFTPLILATTLQAADSVKLLLASGADVTLRDKDGRTALDLAKLTKNAEVTALLETAMTQAAAEKKKLK